MIGQLRCRKDGLSPQEFVATGGIGLRHPGLYIWWGDPVGAATLSAGVGNRIEPGLIDAGLAGATQNRSGKESSNGPGSDMESVIASAWGWLMQQPSFACCDRSPIRRSVVSVGACSFGFWKVEDDETAAINIPTEHSRHIGR
jgi:hypothetical protein